MVLFFIHFGSVIGGRTVENSMFEFVVRFGFIFRIAFNFCLLAHGIDSSLLPKGLHLVLLFSPRD